jgi:hypothetical protein
MVEGVRQLSSLWALSLSLVLGFELRALHLLPAAGALPVGIHPQPFCFSYFSDSLTLLYPGQPHTLICLPTPPVSGVRVMHHYPVYWLRWDLVNFFSDCP